MLALVRCTAMAAIGKGKTNRYVSKDGLQRAKDGLWNRKDRSPRFWRWLLVCGKSSPARRQLFFLSLSFSFLLLQIVFLLLYLFTFPLVVVSGRNGMEASGAAACLR